MEKYDKQQRTQVIRTWCIHAKKVYNTGTWPLIQVRIRTQVRIIECNTDKSIYNTQVSCLPSSLSKHCKHKKTGQQHRPTGKVTGVKKVCHKIFKYKIYPGVEIHLWHSLPIPTHIPTKYRTKSTSQAEYLVAHSV